MTKRRVSDEEFERQYQAVKSARPKPQLEAESVWFDDRSRELVVQLKNGSTIRTAISTLNEFDNASDSDIAAVELTPRGEALHWEGLDNDFSVGGLILSVFGNQRFMAELGRLGGRATTVPKAAAARENGRKGGRPRNISTFRDVRSIYAQLVESSAELVNAALSDASQQALSDLIKHERNLAAVQTPKSLGNLGLVSGLALSDSQQAPRVSESNAPEKPKMFKIKGIEEAKRATLALAA